MNDQKFKTVTIEEVDIFYREAGRYKQTNHFTSSWLSLIFTHVQGPDQ